MGGDGYCSRPGRWMQAPDRKKSQMLTCLTAAPNELGSYLSWMMAPALPHWSSSPSRLASFSVVFTPATGNLSDKANTITPWFLRS